ncbi:hypothetical protein RND81_13G175300 [Saponaria officinalis]|uniref:VQ domain-containing protein n=1 Tax=Saponaria officinalis TaxID=3572 RepID=A0AAW1H128_SAPOF
MSNNYTSEWLHFHPNNSSSLGHVAPSYAATSPPPDGFFSGLVSEATTVTTMAAAPGPAQLGPEGRVSKPARQRARASRRTPTTLISTDTVNFRATVQQFTGGPSSNFAPLGPGAGPGLGYGLPNDMNTSMFMHGNYMGEINDYNNAYVTYEGNNNNNNNNNNNVSGGSSSSENRSNNFHY